MKNWIIAGLVAVIAIGGAVTFAQSSRTANVEVRVWESTSDPTLNYISARPEGGSWRTLGTIPLGSGDASAYAETSNGRFRYSDITLAVPLPDSPSAPHPTPTPTPTATPKPTAAATATPAPSRAAGPVLAEYITLTGVSYVAERDRLDGSLSTSIAVSDEYRDAYGLDQRAIFNIICTGSGEIGIGMSTDEYHRSGRITYRIDNRASVSVTWVADGKNLINPLSSTARGLIEDLRGASRLLIRTSEISLLEFDVSRLFETPVQPNLDNCGQPGWR